MRLWHKHRWNLVRWDHVRDMGRFPPKSSLTWRCDKCGEIRQEIRPI